MKIIYENVTYLTIIIVILQLFSLCRLSWFGLARHQLVVHTLYWLICDCMSYIWQREHLERGGLWENSDSLVQSDQTTLCCQSYKHCLKNTKRYHELILHFMMSVPSHDWIYVVKQPGKAIKWTLCVNRCCLNISFLELFTSWEELHLQTNSLCWFSTVGSCWVIVRTALHLPTSAISREVIAVAADLDLQINIFSSNLLLVLFLSCQRAA